MFTVKETRKMNKDKIKFIPCDEFQQTYHWQKQKNVRSKSKYKSLYNINKRK
jgi:hypothetical protein